MTYGSPASGPIVPPAREGHRRQFSEGNKRRVVEEAARPGASLSEVARRYGIAARVLTRKLSSADPVITTTIKGLVAGGRHARPECGPCRF